MNDLFTYPNSPGYKRAGTSSDAAQTVPATSIKGRVLDSLRISEKTPDECATALGLSILAVRPRFSELFAMNLIEPTGARRRNVSGLTAEVWRIK